MTRMDEYRQYGDGQRRGEIIYKALSYQIMEAVFEVHNTLGPGYIESLYEKALAHELALRDIPFERQKEIEVYYKSESIGLHRLDFIVADKIILELKATSALTEVFKQQTLSYLKVTHLKLGILLNFGTPRVEYLRIVN